MKAISPVIATVIIVAVAIAIAVAVAFWMTGITGTFTRYEKLEITYAYAEQTASDSWTITIRVKNTGPSQATIDDIFINGKPVSAWGSSTVQTISVTNTAWSTSTTTVPLSGMSISLKSGEEATIVLYVTGFKSGQTIEIKLHTAAGNEYPKQVTLP